MDENQTERSLVLDYKQTYGTDSGKRVLNHMKKMAMFDFVDVPLDNMGRIDPFEVVRQLGLRSAIIEIEIMLKRDPNETKGIQNER